MKLALHDIDGVLANDEVRLPHALTGDYARYFAPVAMSLDTVHPEGYKLVQSNKKAGYVTSYLTGRREDRREVTEHWLDSNNFPQGRLTMRSFAQTMPLANFKANYIKKILALKLYTDVVLFDDDPEVIRFIQSEIGPDHAVHCTWQIKEKRLIKLAKI